METLSWETQLERVGQAFSRQSASFDAEDDANVILQWMRERVRRQVCKNLLPGSHILELNAGTGLDSLYFVQQGYRVHATDIAEGMLTQLRQKAEFLDHKELLKVERRSFTQLAALPAQSYDCIFSNFGGLNCAPDLQAVMEQIQRLLKPGGKAVLVIMPKVSPWELAALFKGKFKLAFRRFAKNGAWAQLEGIHFKTYYFSPRRLIRYFHPDFKVIGWQALGSLAPPPHLVTLARRYPGLFRFLTRLEEKWGDKAPFRSWTDHYILSIQYLPNINSNT